MFAQRWYGAYYFARRYFGKFGLSIILDTPATTLQGSYEPSTSITGTRAYTFTITGTL